MVAARGGPDYVSRLSEQVRRLVLPTPYDAQMPKEQLDNVIKEHRPTINHGGAFHSDAGAGVRIGEEYHHAKNSRRILAGYSVGGDAALKAGGPERSGGGEPTSRTCSVPATKLEKWDLRVVAGARVDEQFLDRLERAATSSKMMVVVGIRGDVDLANDQMWMKPVGPAFGDRSYEGIVRAIEHRYGSMEKFQEKFSNVSVQAAEGEHSGGGNRQSTLDAITRGVTEIRARQALPGPVGSRGDNEQANDTATKDR